MCKWKSVLVSVLVSVLSVMVFVGCGDPEVHLVYQENATPIGGSGTGGTGGTGGTTDMGTGTTNTNPGPVTGWPPADPSALGPSSPISSQPCILQGDWLDVPNGASALFADGVLSCTSTSTAEFAFFTWGPALEFEVYVRVGGVNAPWTPHSGTLTPDQSNVELFGVEVTPSTQVDVYIHNASSLQNFFMGFESPSLEGG